MNGKYSNRSCEVSLILEIRSERTQLDTFPLYDFLSFLGVKYATIGILFAAILVAGTHIFGPGGSISPSHLIFDTIMLSAMLFSLAFIAFIAYRFQSGEDFEFFSVAISASIVFFLSTLAISVHGSLSRDFDFHILQALLPLIACIVIGLVFSAFVKIMQKMIAG